MMMMESASAETWKSVWASALLCLHLKLWLACWSDSVPADEKMSPLACHSDSVVTVVQRSFTVFPSNIVVDSGVQLRQDERGIKISLAKDSLGTAERVTFVSRQNEDPTKTKNTSRAKILRT